ncbi:MAG: hypothetical protein ALECFALPRED_009008 [Alectoria fallacina]|uniref:Uncharacterized protein n=1 Tax=Alectoria fallacina TaxID=1903189 RepID=A0A8H3PHY9_9LECA|nr:MAG: hypothetical protein ALECFALPRED_009008 [Alectoria fallacina]
MNSTGFSSDLPIPDVQKAPELTDPLSFIIGGPLSSNLVGDRSSSSDESVATYPIGWGGTKFWGYDRTSKVTLCNPPQCNNQVTNQKICSLALILLKQN